MTTINVLRLLCDLIQFSAGVYVIVFSLKMAYRRWDRTNMDYYTAIVLAVLGTIIILLLRRGM
jgi:hypothetical protein